VIRVMHILSDFSRWFCSYWLLFYFGNRSIWLRINFSDWAYRFFRLFICL